MPSPCGPASEPGALQTPALTWREVPAGQEEGPQPQRGQCHPWSPLLLQPPQAQARVLHPSSGGGLQLSGKPFGEATLGVPPAPRWYQSCQSELLIRATICPKSRSSPTGPEHRRHQWPVVRPPRGFLHGSCLAQTQARDSQRSHHLRARAVKVIGETRLSLPPTKVC